MRPAIVPVHLGCCPEAARCALCPPAEDPPGPDVISALVDRDDHILPMFFGGPPPTDAQVDALQGRPFGIKVRPDLFSRADLDRLTVRGLREVELDALSFEDEATKSVGRRHRADAVLGIAAALRSRDLVAGITLTPGLPTQSADSCRRDAEIAGGVFDFARVLPVLVIAGSGLDERHANGFYRPLSLGEAIGICREMIERLEDRGTRVIRVGLQPGPDGFGRAVAGPRHSSLRELVEAERTLDRVRALVDGAPPGAYLSIRCAPADETRTRGPLNQHVRTLRAEYALREVMVVCDESLGRGEIRVDVVEG